MKNSFVLAITMLFLVGVATSAYAVPTLYLDDPYDAAPALVITDGAAGDINPNVGAVTYLGSFGVWTLNVSTGITKPYQGSAVDAYMDLNSVNSSSGNGTIYIWFTDTDFLPMSEGNFGASVNVGGTVAVGGQAIFGWYLDRDNRQDSYAGSSDQLAITDMFDSGSFSYTGSGSASGLTNPFSLALGANIFHTERGTTSYDQELTEVPEPVSLVLLGSGLVGLGLIRRFGKK